MVAYSNYKIRSRLDGVTTKYGRTYILLYCIVLYCKTREIGAAVEFCAHVTMVDLNRSARYCVAVVKPQLITNAREASCDV